MSPSEKTVGDQVREIEKLVDDAAELLAQAAYSLSTLRERVTAGEAEPRSPEASS